MSCRGGGGREQGQSLVGEGFGLEKRHMVTTGFHVGWFQPQVWAERPLFLLPPCTQPTGRFSYPSRAPSSTSWFFIPPIPVPLSPVPLSPARHEGHEVRAGHKAQTSHEQTSLRFHSRIEPQTVCGETRLIQALRTAPTVPQPLQFQAPRSHTGARQHFCLPPPPQGAGCGPGIHPGLPGSGHGGWVRVYMTEERWGEENRVPSSLH